jgi:hypothetical protein
MKIFLQTSMISLLSVLSTEIGGVYGQTNTTNQQAKKYELKDFVLKSDTSLNTMLYIGNTLSSLDKNEKIKGVMEGGIRKYYMIREYKRRCTVAVFDKDSDYVLSDFSSDSIAITLFGQGLIVFDNAIHDISRRVVSAVVDGKAVIIAYEFFVGNPISKLTTDFKKVTKSDALALALSLSSEDFGSEQYVWIRPLDNFTAEIAVDHAYGYVYNLNLRLR